MKLVCLGDSITYGYGINQLDCWVNIIKNTCKINIINKGLNGDTTSGMLFRVYEDAILKNPTHILITGGTNDFLMGYSRDTVFDNLKCIIKDIKNNNIAPIIGIPIPIYKLLALKYWSKFIDYEKVNLDLKWYRDNIINYCIKNKISYIDFYKSYCEHDLSCLYIDGIHPTKEGHKIMAKNVYF